MRHKFCLFLLIIFGLLLAVGTVEEGKVLPYPNLIRFHVVANSDGEEDQLLKLKVRDAVLEDLSPQLNQANDVNDAEYLIKPRLSEIEKTALRVLRAEGDQNPVSVFYGSFGFPTKTYGAMVLPAGIYRGVKIIIGDGKGANWWCVLFPPLCFVNVTCDEGSLDRRVNSGETLETVLEAGPSFPVQRRWKLVEIIKQPQKFLAQMNTGKPGEKIFPD